MKLNTLTARMYARPLRPKFNVIIKRKYEPAKWFEVLKSALNAPKGGMKIV